MNRAEFVTIGGIEVRNTSFSPHTRRFYVTFGEATLPWVARAAAAVEKVARDYAVQHNILAKAARSAKAEDSPYTTWVAEVINEPFVEPCGHGLARVFVSVSFRPHEDKKKGGAK